MVSIPYSTIKIALRSLRSFHNFVSIPYSTIKMNWNWCTECNKRSFQFLIVRLKFRERPPKPFPSRVSIPYSTIKIVPPPKQVLSVCVSIPYSTIKIFLPLVSLRLPFVSIPYSTIKIVRHVAGHTLIHSFNSL